MFTIINVVRVATGMAVVLALAPWARADQSSTGGVAAPERPVLTGVDCDAGDGPRCPRGDIARVRGLHLQTARAIVFLGRGGSGDDRTARARSRSDRLVSVTVPRDARSGPVRVVSAAAGASPPSASVRIVSASAAGAATPRPSEPDDGVFPVTGRTDEGTSVNRFGGGRGHQGQDLLADCGTPVVAALGGTVRVARFESRAGNYAVIDSASGASQVYMHLERPASVVAGDAVAAGQRIGAIGRTGHASACHLHFESWSAPGWHAGGRPQDPLPALRRWRAGRAERPADGTFSGG